MSEERPWRNEARLRQMYLEEEMSTYEIGEVLGCSRVTVSNWLSEFEIERRDRQPDDCPLQDEELLRELYLQRELSLSGVAENVGCTVWKVRYWLTHHGIETREPGGSTFAVPELTDYNWIQTKYIEEELTSIEIAEFLDCSPRTVSAWLDKHGIDCPWHLPQDAKKYLENEEKMWTLYEENGLSSTEIANRLGCSVGYVGDYLREYGFTDYEMVGEDHPLWNGGDYVYGEGWCKGKRETVRERDDYTCQLCGIEDVEHKSKYSTKLHVHHIKKARNVSADENRNALENLITLCAACHVKAEKVAPELPEGIDDR